MDRLRHRPAVFLLVRLEPAIEGGACGPGTTARWIGGGWRPLARASHPGVIGLAATLGTGAWPERHGLFRSTHPHRDRLSMVRAALEPTGLPVLWHDVVSAGGRAAVVGWPHATLPPSDTADGELLWVDDRVTAACPVEGGGSPPIRSGSVLPEVRRPDHRPSPGVRWHLVPDLLRAMADEGPDLLVGWLDEDGDDHVEDLVATVTDRLRSRGTAGVVVLELRHARPGTSILAGPRFEAAPLLRIRSHDCSFELPGALRPRVEDRLGRPCRAGHRSRSASGEPRSRGRRLRPRRGIHGPRAATARSGRGIHHGPAAARPDSGFARGASADALPWIRATCEDRHGRVDPRLAGLLLMLAPSKMERGRLLESLRSRIGPVAETWDRIEAGVPVPASELETQLGPFVSGALRCRRRPGGDRRRQE